MYSTVNVYQTFAHNIGVLFFFICEAPIKQDDTSCPMRSYTVTVGEQLSICCPVSGYPPPEVTWEKNGAQLQKGEHNMYTITTVKDEDFGNYACTATDGKSSIGPFNSSVMKIGKFIKSLI